MNKSYYVYILKCSDDSYYVGITNDLERRLFEHRSGLDTNSYTFHKRPLKLIYFEEFSEAIAAITFEKQVKGWSRKKKEALIKKDWDEVSKLAKKLF